MDTLFVDICMLSFRSFSVNISLKHSATNLVLFYFLGPSSPCVKSGSFVSKFLRILMVLNILYESSFDSAAFRGGWHVFLGQAICGISSNIFPFSAHLARFCSSNLFSTLRIKYCCHFLLCFLQPVLFLRMLFIPLPYYFLVISFLSFS